MRHPFLCLAVAALVAGTVCGCAHGVPGAAPSSSSCATATATPTASAAQIPSGWPTPTGSPTQTASPTPAPTLAPTVASELRSALGAVRAIPGVASAKKHVSVVDEQIADPACPGQYLDRPAFTAVVTVVMDADAPSHAAAEVPTAMAERISWTGVDLRMTVPAAPGRVAATVEYDGTFDQQIPLSTAEGVADGVARIASTPHVTSVDAEIPMTMRVDYGTLTVRADTHDPTELDQIRTVIDDTAFRDTTLHGSFGNGAKP